MTGPGSQHRWPPRTDEDYRGEARKILGTGLANRFGAVKLLVLDADGVLTPGNLVYSADGEALKEFHAHDGLGLVMARLGGLKRAVLTGRNSRIVERRCTELRFDAIKLGRFDKVAALHEICAETGCDPRQALYVGDDLIDLPPMQVAGLAVSVPNGALELEDFCDYTTQASGGKGAVREVVELILKAGGRYGLALTRLLEKEWQPSQGELSSDGEAAAAHRNIPEERQ